MTTPPHDLVPDFDPERDLFLSLHLDVPRPLVWRCWTEPALLVQWFTPAPWSTASAELDVRPGGSLSIVMRSPDGQEVPNRGVYLEVEPERRLVTTDAFTRAWVPAEQPFMTADLRFEDEDGGTRYHALARHGTPEQRRSHDEMGFTPGWTAAAGQLVALARSL